jgi:hypothetical protein
MSAWRRVAWVPALAGVSARAAADEYRDPMLFDRVHVAPQGAP